MAQYIYGKNVVLERLKSGSKVSEVYFVDEIKDTKFLNKINQYLRVKPTIISKSRAIKMVGDRALHQGIIAKVGDYEYTSYLKMIEKVEKKEDALILMLDGIEDPHNFGAILRTCDAIGVDAIIVGKHGNAPLSETVVKVSTGAIEYLSIVEVTNLNNTINDLKQRGFWIVGAEADNAQDYRELKYDMKTVLVVGSEGFGISKLVLKNCDYKIKLPMVGHVNSLNVSVATAILLYNIHAQRNPIK